MCARARVLACVCVRVGRQGKGEGAREEPADASLSSGGFNEAMAALERAVAATLPDVAAHFATHDIQLAMFTQRWLHCLFCHPSIKEALTLGIWDQFVDRGMPYLLEVAVALMALARDRILATHGMEHMLPMLQNLTAECDPPAVLAYAASHPLAPALLGPCESLAQIE